MMLVFSGLIDEGMAELDRSLAAICGGGVTELPVIEGCLCGLLNACERTNDVDRAEQWLAAAQSTIRRGNLLSAAGYCRAHYAGILISSGEWDRSWNGPSSSSTIGSHCAIRPSAAWRSSDSSKAASRTLRS